MTPAKKLKWATMAAPLLLIVLSTVIAELVIGSTPVSRINVLVLQFFYYGTAALVIREVVVRLHLSRTGLVVLGLAFGLITEGIVLQSVFNPNFLNLDISFGRSLEVNWPWSIYMVGYHAFWSVTIPITLVELIFRDRKEVPWTNKPVTGVFLVIFILMALAFNALFKKLFHFSASPVPYAVTVVIVVLLLALGLKLKRRDAPMKVTPTRPAYVPALATFLFGAIWFVLYAEVFKQEKLLPAQFNTLVGMLVTLTYVLACRRFFRGDWPVSHRFAQITGGLAASSLFGLFVVSGSGVRIDIYSQIGIILAGAALLRLLWIRLSRSGNS